MPHPVALRRSIFLCFALTTLLASRTLAHDVEAAGRSTDKNAISTRTVAGDVEIVVIDDRPNHATYEYRQLRQADGSLTVLRGSPAESLQTGSHVEVVGAHAGKTFVVSSVRALAKGVDINRATAQTIDIEGAFSIAHSDNFTAGKSEFIYELREDNGHAWSLELASSAPVLKGGMRIKANGIPNAEATSLRPSQIAILSADGVSVPTEKRAAIPEKALNTALVIMASFNNAAVPSMTQSDAQLVMISNASSVANFFNEASFGQQTFSVTVTNWVTMNIAKPATCNTSDWQGIGNAAATAAANGGWSPANYGFVVYLFPQVSACGWNGLAYIGSPHKAFINGTNSFVTSVIAHEMGHNFGLFHAGSVDCGSAPIGGSCTAAEYGDPFDTMGNQRAMHYNAQQKRKLNWISASSVATHTAGSAIYTLSPIESGGGSLYAVKIPTGSASRTYWVEFRQPIGFDSPLAAYPNNGAQIRVANPFEIYCAGCDSISDDTELLDMTPGTSSFNDATLVVGNAFHDSSNGLSIS
ncbi:MAG TPA: M12 family metallo-peptidase, partial [Casimicrobiaceae bacterium]